MDSPAERLPWQQVDRESALPGLVERTTHPEFAGIEFLHVRAKSLVNHVPEAAGLPFEHTINVYRGCTHDCSYCLAGETPILMADGTTRPLAKLRVGDRIYGTRRLGWYRHYVPTMVLDHWSTVREVYRVRLTDGTVLVASGDHRFLSNRGWRHVTGTQQGARRRPHLTTRSSLMGTGGFASPPDHDADYRRGYLCGMIRGDGHLGACSHDRTGRSRDDHYRFRLALTDVEALDRTAQWLALAGVSCHRSVVREATGTHRRMLAIRNSTRQAHARITNLVDRPAIVTTSWRKGFLAGIFDAEGSLSRGILRIADTDPMIIRMVTDSLDRLGFDRIVESRRSRPAMRNVRLRGGLPEQLRFLHSVDPAITRKRTIDGRALRSAARLQVESVERLPRPRRMYDITTGTGDFIADGVVSHNCFARPTHRYLELDPDREFASVIVVKVNAVERLRADLRRPSWDGAHIAMGTNTDPYQRCEGRYRLTRGVVETLTRAGNPFSVLTKGTLVTRDLDVLVEAQRRRPTPVNLSIPTLDEDVWRQTEPGTPHPRRRMETVARLNDAGVPSGVMMAPVIPGLSDARSQLEAVVTAAVEAGATFVRPIVLHLRPGVREIFLDRLGADRPDLRERHERMYGGSRAPRAYRRRVGRLVDELVEAAGGVRGLPPRGRRQRPRDDEAREGTDRTGEQPGLGL